MTNLTIGVGGDFPQISDAFAYLAALGALADDYTFTQISDYTVTNDNRYTTGPLNGHTVLFTCDNWHKGNPNQGYTITIRTDWWSRRYSIDLTILDTVANVNTNDGEVIFEKLHFEQNYSFDTTAVRIHISVPPVDIPIGPYYGDITLRMRNLIYQGHNSAAVAIISLSPHMIYQHNRKHHYSDIKIFDYNGTALYFHSISFFGIEVNNVALAQDGQRQTFENIIVHDTRNGTGNGRADMTFAYVDVRNVVFVCTNTDWGTGRAPDWAGFVVENSADTDDTINTGTNLQHNIVPADEFQSLDNASDDYLKLINGTNGEDIEFLPGAPQLGVNGIAPTYAGNTDIEGNARPGADGTYSIGPTEQQYDSIPYVYANSEYTNRNLILWLFLGDATAVPRYGSVPLEVDFTPGNPYDAIIEVSTAYDYVIIEESDSEYIIEEGPLG